MAAPIALQPTATLGERVLLPGDPGRALMLAESLLDGAKMFNHNRGLGADGRVPASPDLLDAVITAAEPSFPNEDAGPHAIHRGPILTTDLFYDDRGLERQWAEAGALAVEMEAATLFALASARAVQAAALLVVSDLVLPERVRIGEEALRAAERRMGEAALRALMAGRGGTRTSAAARIQP